MRVNRHLVTRETRQGLITALPSCGSSLVHIQNNLVDASSTRSLSTLPRYFEQPWQKYWTYQIPKATDGSAEHPHKNVRRVLRKKVEEWREYHGTQSIIEDSPPWAYADGTPAPHRPKDHSRQHWEHKVLHQFIEAAAIVEDLQDQDRLPAIPATQVQRDWDPNIPLFLEDSHEAGRAPGSASVSDDGGLKPLFVGTDPADYIKEPYPLPPNKTQRPFWSRRHWGLTSSFLLERPKQRPNWNENE